MRRLRAIYFFPLFVLLIASAVIGGYKMLLVPEMEKVKNIRAEWETERKAMESVLGQYPSHLQQQLNAANMIVNAYDNGYAKIQSGMPDIKNIPSNYADQYEQLRYLYQLMGSDKLIRELSKWARGFKLEHTPSFAFSGTLGFESSIPNLSIVHVTFPRQRVRAKNIDQLISEIQRTSGYGYFPLYMKTIAYDPEAFTAKKVEAAAAKPTSMPGTTGQNPPPQLFLQQGVPLGGIGPGTTAGGGEAEKPVYNLPSVVEIRVRNDGNNRYNPRLEMDYAARGFFMVRGYDPLSVNTRDGAKQIIANPPKGKAVRKAPPSPCPKLLWFIDPQIPAEPKTPPGVI